MVEIPNEARQELDAYIAELEAHLEEVKSASAGGKNEAIVASLEHLGAKATEAVAFVRGLQAPVK